MPANTAPATRLEGSAMCRAGLLIDDEIESEDLKQDARGFLYDGRTGRYFTSEVELVQWEIADLGRWIESVKDHLDTWDEPDERIPFCQSWLSSYDRLVWQLVTRGVPVDATPAAAERFPYVVAHIDGMRRQMAAKTAGNRITRAEVNEEIRGRLDPETDLQSPHVATDRLGRLYDSRDGTYFETVEAYLEHQRADLAQWIENGGALEGDSDTETVWRTLDAYLDEYDRLVVLLDRLGAAVDPRPAAILFRDAVLQVADRATRAAAPEES